MYVNFSIPYHGVQRGPAQIGDVALLEIEQLDYLNRSTNSNEVIYAYSRSSLTC